ncbi:Phosphotransferase enzyme family protein [Sulfitobacter sp. THAF37]|uniref:aminoglycoside phosphotransferase family protein n=1 Tax=Sulfitobacter sp. THAF37 TaxID=2587855 RepID=UPI00126879F7|nr:phosphotransferase [Sulfitobacter sp. THAF37]QFT59229.1 Phosphotransferase enzyme family protein [Sulfitobacter sp. THAF37]
MTPDHPQLHAFLARHGLENAAPVALPGDASARRYYRLPGAGLLVMEDPKDPVGFAAFIRLSAHLRALGLSAPEVLAKDTAQGLALIEDFGTTTYGALLGADADETALYALAVDALAHLHGAQGATAVAVPDYSLDTFLDELTIFSDWFVPALRPDMPPADFDAPWRALWRQALGPLEGRPHTLVLRDFHIDNLMLLKDRTGVARCGLLDFQDAVAGPAEYDLVSLLQDARRDLAPGLEALMLKRYLAAVPAGTDDRAGILHRYHLLGAQRHTRIAGLFPRLDRRDGKPGYLRFMPRVMGQMQTALRAAGLTGIEDYLDTTLPGWRAAAGRFATG